MLTVLVCYLQLTKMRLYYDPVGLISPIFPANKVLKKLSCKRERFKCIERQCKGAR